MPMNMKLFFMFNKEYVIPKLH